MKNLYHNIKILCSPDIEWVVEKEYLILIVVKTGEIITLQYPDAALWDFISREISLNRIIKMISIIGGSNKQQTEIWLYSKIQSWLKKGLLIEGNRHG